MLFVSILGVGIWLLMYWIKRRWIKTHVGDFESKLPKDFLDKPNVSTEQKRTTYTEARKKFMEDKKNKPMDLMDEIFLRQGVKDEFGYFETDGNEGALALAERRRRKAEAERKLKKETKKRMDEATAAGESKPDNTTKTNSKSDTNENNNNSTTSAPTTNTS